MKESKKKKWSGDTSPERTGGKKKEPKNERKQEKKMVWRYQSRKNRGKKKGTEK